MATQVIMICPNGEKQLVSVASLTDDDRKNKFLCAGITPEGELCGCPVIVTNKTNRRNAYAREHNVAHKEGCSACRRRSAIDVEKLDKLGKKTSVKGLYDKLNQEKAPRAKKGKATEEEGFFETEEYQYTHGEKDSFDNRGIRHTLRNPRDFQEVYELIASLPSDSPYADRLVFDLMLDERTVDAYRRLGSVPTQWPFIVVTRKAIPRQRGFFLKNDQWLLVDFWGKEHNAFFFILTVTPEAKQKLWNLCEISPAVKIIVWAEFRKDPTRPRTYISSLVKPEMIFAEVINGQ